MKLRLSQNDDFLIETCTAARKLGSRERQTGANIICSQRIKENVGKIFASVI